MANEGETNLSNTNVNIAKRRYEKDKSSLSIEAHKLKVPETVLKNIIESEQAEEK